jgi:MFS family permease
VLAFEAAWWIFVISLEIPTGIITDRWGRKRSLVVGSLLFTLGFLVFGFSASPVLLLSAYLIWGLGDSFISGTDTAFLFETLEKKRAAEKYAQYEGFLNSGAFLIIAMTTALGPILLLWTPLSVPFILTALFGLILVCASMFLSEPRTQESSIEDSRAVGFKSTISVLADPSVAGIICLKAIPEMSVAILLLTLPLTLSNYGLPTFQFGWWMALIFVLMGFSSIWAGRAIHFLSLPKWFGMASFASAMAIILSTATHVWLFPLCVLPALFLPLLEPHVNQYLAERAVQSNRATILSVANAAMSVVIATSIFGGAWAMDQFGFVMTMRIFAGATIVLTGIGFTLWFAGHRNSVMVRSPH